MNKQEFMRNLLTRIGYAASDEDLSTRIEKQSGTEGVILITNPYTNTDLTARVTRDGKEVTVHVLDGSPMEVFNRDEMNEPQDVHSETCVVLDNDHNTTIEKLARATGGIAGAILGEWT